MKAKIKIEATLDISRGDYETLKAAGPVELVQTAQMQGAKISTRVERTRSAVKDEQEETAR